jgi:hypothetical protein
MYVKTASPTFRQSDSVDRDSCTISGYCVVRIIAKGTLILTRVQTHAHTRTHTHTHTQIHTYMHARAHTHIMCGNYTQPDSTRIFLYSDVQSPSDRNKRRFVYFFFFFNSIYARG